MSEPKFKIGDKVQLNAIARKQFPRIKVQPWEVLGVNDRGSIVVKVPRTRSQGFRRDTFSSDWLELVESAPVFSEAQLITINEMIDKRVAEKLREHEENVSFHG